MGAWRSSRGIAGTNNDIVRRRYCFIDADPIRKPGYEKHHATAAEKAAAILYGQYLFQYEFVAGLGAMSDSGNGCGILSRVDLPGEVTTTAQYEDFYRNRIVSLSTPEVRLDPVFDLRRFMKVPGTFNYGKKEAVDRPVRQSRWLIAPEGDMPINNALRNAILSHSIVPTKIKLSAFTPVTLPSDLSASEVTALEKRFARACHFAPILGHYSDDLTELSSASERDFRFLSALLFYKFTPREALFLSRRRRTHDNNPEKSLRDDYWTRTLSKALCERNNRD
jgi:hypothetical protein